MSDRNLAIASITIQQPLSEVAPSANHCPYCSSKNIKDLGMIMTCLGRNNHHWYSTRCKDCKKEYVYEFREGYDNDDYTKPVNVWYQEPGRNGRVIKGINTCCGGKIYDCKCGGLVQYSIHNLDGSVRQPTVMGSVIMSYSQGKADFFERFSCDRCGAFVDIKQGNN